MVLLSLWCFPMIAHTHADHTYWAHILSPPTLNLVLGDDPEIPISSNDSSLTGSHWVPINDEDSSVYPFYTLKTNWTFTSSGVPLCCYYNSSSCNTNSSFSISIHKQWYMNSILRNARNHASTIKYQNFILTIGVGGELCDGKCVQKTPISVWSRLWLEMGSYDGFSWDLCRSCNYTWLNL